MSFKQARKKVFSLGKLSVDTDGSFMLRKKITVWSPKRMRGFIAISGVEGKEHSVFTVSAGFMDKDGHVPFAFPFLHTLDIDQAIKAFKNKKAVIRLLRGVHDV